MTDGNLWGRKASLLLLDGPLYVKNGNNPSAYIPGAQHGLDLTDTHFSFHVSQQDVESPNNCTIRVYNLAADIVRQIRGEFSRIVLSAGYESSFGVIFDGTIKQFRIGKENATDSYLDILAADGDIGYIWSTLATNIAGGSSTDQRFAAIAAGFAPYGISAEQTKNMAGGILPRGKVLFGMTRAFARDLAATAKVSWSFHNGKLVTTPLDGYSPKDVVELSAATGLIGMPESTEEGVKFRCLLNPLLEPGCRCKIDNKSVNQTLQQNPSGPAVPFNHYKGLQFFADVAADGLYRMFVVEHSGDTRGQAWYTDVVGLALNPTTGKVKPYG
jgi:hypothetical protein